MITRMTEQRRTLLRRDTTISTESEFALFDARGRPLGRRETEGTIERARNEFGSRMRWRQTEVVAEVAPNAIELKICFSTVAEIREDLAAAYRILGRIIAEMGIRIISTSQPTTSGAIGEGLTHFLSTDIFQKSAENLAATNSVQFHVGIESFDEGLAVYNAANRFASPILALTQCAVIDGRERGRAALVAEFFENLPSELANPWNMQSIGDYEKGMESARQRVEEIVQRMAPERIAELAVRYPTFVTTDGRVLQWTPDKIFQPARMRLDKEVPGMGLVGSVEFRPIDGQPTLQATIAAIELTLGLLAQPLTHHTDTLEKADRDIGSATRRIAEYGLSAISWNGLGSTERTHRQAINGIISLGLVPEQLSETSPLDGGNAEFRVIQNLSPEDIIGVNHRRFMRSVGVD
ncbi:TPA: hypothetical protein HA238_02665 [Candidatus Micrarchaeota archaeon]|nr:hypothetical protein [Candidatus Micrarchaeota archaeon]